MIIHYYFINNYWLFQTSMDDLDTDEYIRRIQALNAIKDRWWQRLWIRIQQLCGSLFRIRIRIRTVKNRGKRLDWRTKIHNLNWKLSSCVIIFVNFIKKRRNWRKENIIIFFFFKIGNVWESSDPDKNWGKFQDPNTMVLDPQCWVRQFIEQKP